MSIRISDSYVAKLLVGDMNRSLAQLLEQQRMAATLRRVNAYADDPRAVASIGRLNDLLAANADYMQNVGRTRTLVDATDAALQELSGILSEFEVIVVRESSATASGTTMAVSADEVDALLGRMMSVLNTAVEGQYLFAGRRTDLAPFVQAGAEVVYRGDQGEIRAATGPHSTIVVNVTGQGFAGAGGYFRVLEDVATALRAGDQATVLAAVDRIETLRGDLSAHLIGIGGRQNDLDWADQALAARDERLRASLSLEQDADVARVATDLSRTQAAYEASLMVTSKLFQYNLLDFLS